MSSTAAESLTRARADQARIEMRRASALRLWLGTLALLIVAMILIGGATRLTDSGLSITEWKPVYGVIPPSNEKEWQEEFLAYQATPQYKLINRDMTITGFKSIFWPEYFHRLLGRLIGIVFAVPLVVFALRRSISKALLWRMIGILFLGGMQGGIGWIMVKSGLQDNPYVSHLKLALHLSLAFIIFALILWTIFDIIYHYRPDIIAEKCPTTTYRIWFALLCIQIVFGGFMAGLHAGLIYNTWPTMNGEFLPDGVFSPPAAMKDDSSSLASRMLHNIAFIQFTHRTVAVFLVIGFLLWWYSYRDYIEKNRLNNASICLFSIIFIQFVLGVLTLIYHVPLSVALFHHFTALILWTAALFLLYKLSYCRNQNQH